MSARYWVAPVLLSVAGCSSNPHVAYINDVAVPYAENTGYELVEVDGVAPNRKRGWIHTYVPYGMVEPGEHTFVLQKKDAPQDKLSIAGVVEADKTYRLARTADDAIELVEETR